MGEIVKRIKMFDFVEVEIFDENQILNDPVEKWPLCDCLISFHSKVKIDPKINLKNQPKNYYHLGFSSRKSDRI